MLEFSGPENNANSSIIIQMDFKTEFSDGSFRNAKKRNQKNEFVQVATTRHY